MNKFRLFLLAVFPIMAALSGCFSESSGEASYHGVVHESSTDQPFANLDVLVTDGENIHTQTKTNSDGEFTVTVKIKEISGEFYILIGDDTCIKKKVSLPGYAEGVNELGIILVDGPYPPKVKTRSSFTVDVNRLACGGEVTSDGRLSVTDRGICYSKLSYPTVEDGKVSEGTGTGVFSTVIRDLELGATYFFRAFATNSKGTSYGEQYSFSTGSGLPVVKTRSVTSVTPNSAKCSGTVVSDGGFSISALGICWATTPDPTTDDFVAHESVSMKDFTCTLSGLKVSTTYYVRAFATNSTGTTYGDQLSFKTEDGLPRVKTNQPTSTATTISMSGTVTSDSGYNVTERGFCYSTDKEEPTIYDAKVINGTGTGTFTATITGLPTYTIYFLRAYATNVNGTTYGESYVISTKSGFPTVTTQEKYESGLDYLVVSGTAYSESGFPIIRKGVCWSLNPNPSTHDGVVLANNNTMSFSCRIEGLQSGTKYYCRAFAENAYGIAYGSSYRFTTQYPPTMLSGHVYDQDGHPVAGATIQGYDISSSYSATSDNDGYYSINLGSISGNCHFSVSATGYDYKVIAVSLTRGQETRQDIQLSLTYSFAVDFGTGFWVYPGHIWEMGFNCTQSSLAGKTTTRNLRIKNYRSVPVTWSLSGAPSAGIAFSRKSGTIPAQEEISITVTFTYPSSTSLVVKLTGCNSGSKAYIWNWEAAYAGYYLEGGNPIQTPCSASCWQNPVITIDGYSEGFTVYFNQFVTYK